MPSSEQVPCLYCEQPKPKTDEHVVQDGLGGSVKLKGIVCGDCNTKVFSSSDGKLIRYVRELACHDHPHVASRRTALAWSPGVFFDGDLGCWVSIRMSNFQPFDQLVLPVVASSPPFDAKVVLDPDRKGSPMARLDQMMGELRAPTTLNLKPWVVPGHSPTVEQAIIRTAPNSYLLRGDTQDDVDKLKAMVLAGQFREFAPTAAPTRGSVANPTVSGAIPTELPAISQALAKTAMNFLTLAWGVEVAREERFRPARMAILGGTRSLDLVRMFNGKDEEPFGAIDDHHGIVLVAAQNNVAASIWLYQQRIATVRLADATTSRDELRAGFFNYKTGAYRILDVTALAAMLSLGSF